MAVGFGFSVSDICIGLKLLKESVVALDEKKGASTEFNSLLSELDNFETGLQSIESLWKDGDLQRSQKVALQSAITACRATIEEFLDSIAKYQPHLAQAKSTGFADRLSKIKWRICRKEDLKDFRCKLERHVSSINMLLITVQTKLSLTSTQSSSDSTGKHVNEDALSMSQDLTIAQRQHFLSLTEQNRELLRTIQELQTMLKVQQDVPSQILLQQPVILFDALGRTAPFHLEFVDSVDCFFAVLHARFANTGIGPQGLGKVKDGEFTLQDTRCKRQIDFEKPWRNVFRPGQQVDMQMVYHRFACATGHCPSCGCRNEEGAWETQCEDCGLTYKATETICKHSDEWMSQIQDDDELQIEGNEIPYMVINPWRQPETMAFRPPKAREGAAFDGFRRVNVVSQSLNLLDPLFPSLLLVEDFTNFANLIDDISPNSCAYFTDVEILGARARSLVAELRIETPAFASFHQLVETRRRLTRESQKLREDINTLVINLCNDPSSVQLIRHIKQGWSSEGIVPFNIEIDSCRINKPIKLLRGNTENDGGSFRTRENRSS